MRRILVGVVVVGAVALVAVSFLGNSASLRFTEVGSAVSGGGGSGVEIADRPAQVVGPSQPGTAADPDVVDSTGPADAPGPLVASLAGTTGADPGRRVISTASLTVEVDSVATASAEAVVAAEAVGGLLFGESSTYTDVARSVLTLKVPPEAFTTTLAAFADLGRPRSQEVSTDDVTARVVDLGSRILTAQASVDRLRSFMDGVTTVADVAAMEGELLARETELEGLGGQLRTLETQVDLATVVLTLVEPKPEPDPDPALALAEEGRDEAQPLPGFFDGLQNGWAAFLNIGTIALALIGLALPFLPVALAAYLAVRLSRRFLHVGREGSTTNTAATPADA